jgi:hypothetical protein
MRAWRSKQSWAAAMLGSVVGLGSGGANVGSSSDKLGVGKVGDGTLRPSTYSSSKKDFRGDVFTGVISILGMSKYPQDIHNKYGYYQYILIISTYLLLVLTL